jgi:hypothetical protein
MALFSKDPEKEAQKQREAEEHARQQEEAAFLASPVGRARTARSSAQRFFEIILPISATDRTMGGMLSGDKTMRTVRSDDHHTVLEQIENEGWRLEHAGYVFQETGTVSRDKLLSSGQTSAITGMIVGVYLFRAIPGE